MSRSFLVLVLLAGCGDDGVGAMPDAPPSADAPVDAHAYDFTCVGLPIATTAPDPATVSGTLRSYDNARALPGLTVAVARASDGVVLGTDVTDANGQYQTSIATGGAALEIYRRASGAGYTTTRTYTFDIFSADLPLTNAVTSVAEKASLASGFGITFDPQEGTIATVIRDCLNAPVAGARITVSPAPERLGYFNTAGAADPAATATGPDGFAFAFGMPPGPATVTVSLGGTTWRARPVGVEADALSLSFRMP